MFSGISVPVRIPDFHSYLRSQGLPEFYSSEGVLAFLVAPISHQGEDLGYILLAKNEPGQAFTHADEETLVMFATQAAAGDCQRPQISE